MTTEENADYERTKGYARSKADGLYAHLYFMKDLIKNPKKVERLDKLINLVEEVRQDLDNPAIL